MSKAIFGSFGLIVHLTGEGVGFAMHALWSNRLRTFLSLLGITIGIFAVISVFTFVDSWNRKIRSSLANLGDDVVYVEKWPWEFGGDYPWWKYMNRPSAQFREMEWLRSRTKSARAVTMTYNLDGGTATAGEMGMNAVSVQAVAPDYHLLRAFELESGRYFHNSELDRGSRSLILGARAANELFPDGNALGKQVKVMGQRLKVVGVLAVEGNNALGTSLDEQFLVPLNFIRQVKGSRLDEVNPLILAGPNEGVPVAELKAELRGHLRAFRRLKPTQEDNFAVNQVSFLANQLDMLFASMRLIGWLIGGFSMLVGGFGIANIMFVSVFERIGQIGIQKAMGARNAFILWQFLVESMILSLMGGVLGVILVEGMTRLAAAIMEEELSLTVDNIILALGVSTLIGIVAGLLPAIRASRLDPVEAIRMG
ncbi:MAG: ABC transporter permease [Bacteroidetes bacterium]|nr:ABC transporter permease [Bacteroidota bacterium]